MTTIDTKIETLARGESDDMARDEIKDELRRVLAALTRFQTWTRVVSRLLANEREARKQAEFERDKLRDEVEGLRGGKAGADR